MRRRKTVPEQPLLQFGERDFAGEPAALSKAPQQTKSRRVLFVVWSTAKSESVVNAAATYAVGRMQGWSVSAESFQGARSLFELAARDPQLRVVLLVDHEHCNFSLESEIRLLSNLTPRPDVLIFCRDATAKLNPNMLNALRAIRGQVYVHEKQPKGPVLNPRRTKPFQCIFDNLATYLARC